MRTISSATFGEYFADAPPSLAAERLRRVVLSGNPPHSDYEYGWMADRFGRHTTDCEKAWLRANGFRFSGGKWWRSDA